MLQNVTFSNLLSLRSDNFYGELQFHQVTCEKKAFMLVSKKKMNSNIFKEHV